MTDEKKPLDPIPSSLAMEDESFIELVQEFVDGLPERIRALDEAVVAADFDRVRMLAHQLKGSAGGYGYLPMTRQATALEEDAQAGDLAGVEGAVAELKDLIDRIVVVTEESDQ